MEEKVSMKRKRVQTQLTLEEKELRLKTLNDELNSLFNYFNEVLNSDITSSLCLFKDNVNLNAAIAVLLEEKRCSYSKLANEIYEKMKDRDGVTVASVKASVLFVGQRISYGVANGDADVLEDESDSCLWCWETRDMKLLPSSLRGALKIRRICRKKISERITAVQDVITSLKKYEDNLSCKHSMTKATEKLKKILSEADIRMLVESLAQKNDSEMAEKEAKKTGTSLVKELEKNKLKAEKEKKKMDRELQKEKLQSEKERKRLQLEAEREEKRREKEDSEMRKHLKRKLEEADKEQRQKEKEEAELKKQLAVQKQASIMERFLKKSRTTSTSQNDQSTGVATSISNVNKRENTFESVSLMMDSALQHTCDIDVQEIRKCHMNSWRLTGHSVRSNKHHWGTRRKPKTQLIKELKLTTNNELNGDDDLGVDGLVDRQGEMCGDGKSCHDHSILSSQGTRKCFRRKQLLQFDKSNRPAFYGIWPKKSHVVGLRHPFKKDPDLDYEIDSDEEWEEEEPGESLSDSDKEDEEVLDEGSCKGDDEEENEDGFFVPDGYLSESEGVENDRSKSDFGAEVTNSSPSRKAEAEGEECSSWTRQQKYLRSLTENALRKNQPLVIINLMHEKTNLLSAEDLSGTLKVEQMCLQALSILAFPGGSCIEVPNINLHEEKHDVSSSNSKGCTTASAVATTIPDSDLPNIVSVIQSCAQGMGRLLDALQKSFPDVSKTLLKNKVREISDYDPVANRWKVKKDILGKLGMATPEKTKLGTKNIATFFSKRCLPPARLVVNLCESSPEPMKHVSSSQQPHESAKNV
ncbi:chromatin assembly factor 1 subunit FAS1-like [Silene latifolia]|uniref:chromatin assembly factor 1 subunit FAS1-like n=1 Tax=Silene latifolia TaxID=37657 RepID=UPI003D7739CD